ncbi:gluconate 2-dehydrogenase subunit 3 family protein [Pararhodonellum marinum]|uniref:gluconate 2-dehydrogenase subunit 3 family protein n=1 Tax=Pararhodonellum marinum TaxID=2755358 RepID=UPI00188EB23E|nr:gluconate 2-dehydrogenase subunit 3 family protein [Pararhodonellum marinum]
MNRRLALKNLALISGGLILVPSCDFSQEEILEAYDKLKITPSQNALIAQIADTIIPPGKIKGAQDISVQDFILIMVNDCYSEEQQASFITGLNGFEAYSKNNKGKKFQRLDQAERESLILNGLQDKAEENKDLSTFLSMTKRLTIQGFMSSEYMQTEVKPYSLIPGAYQGAVLISNLNPEQLHG